MTANTETTDPEAPPPAGWWQYIAFEQSVLQAAVALADSKASFLLASAMGMMIYLLNTLFAPTTNLDHLGRTVMWVAASMMALCAAIAFTIIFPRIRDSQDDNIVYWGSPMFRGDRAAYVDRCLSLSRTHSALHRQQSEHLHRMAGILRAKYARLKVGLCVLGAGLALFVTAQILR